MTTEPRYQFGPLERQGFVAGLTLGQVGVLTVALAVAVLTVRSDSTGRGFVAAAAVLAAAAAAAFWRVGGRTAQEWSPVAARWAVRRLRGQHRYRSAMPLLGLVDGQAAPAPPETLAGVRLLAETVEWAGQQICVIHDSRAGTYSAVLAVRGRSFELADAEDKARRLEAWGSVLAGLGRASSPIHRLQWVERTAPDDGEELGRYLASAVQVPGGHPSLASYLDLVDSAGPASQPHECFLVVSISTTKCRRAIRSAGGGDKGAAAVLVREVMHLARELQSAEVLVDGALTPRMVARAMRIAFDPAARAKLARRAAGAPDEAGTTEGNAWPLAAEEAWSTYRTEGAWHATYWVAQWPRMPVGPDFLAHLLLGTTAMRTVSLTMEPIPSARAHREVENALVQGMADDELRANAGFMGTARRRREREATARREEELAVGHADFRMCGFVTVTATDPDELMVACGEIEQAAERSRLELRRLYGEQDTAFTCTLPLGRGVA